MPFDPAMHRQVNTPSSSHSAAVLDLTRHSDALSHQLRTPMQGIVGGLDMLRATIQRAREAVTGSTPTVFSNTCLEDLEEDINAISECARRAIEASDNIVHAFELNMGLPTPDTNIEAKIARLSGKKPCCSVSALPVTVQRPSLKRRVSEGDHDERRPITKRQRFQDSPSDVLHIFGRDMRLTNVRDFVGQVVSESITVGKQHEIIMTTDTALGSLYKFQATSGVTTGCARTVQVDIDPAVPACLCVDVASFAKIIRCLMSNALKFSPQGSIVVCVTFSEQARMVRFHVKDNGPGISAWFQPFLFSPFEREDGSRSRRTEGLGLGLMVARGLARKSGGDVVLESTITNGPRTGTEFVLHFPAKAGVCSPPSPPFAHLPPSPPASTTLSPIQTPAQSSSTSHRRFSAPLPDFPPSSKDHISPNLATKYPMTFLISEDNSINRKLLSTMLLKLGYPPISIIEAADGIEAVQAIETSLQPSRQRIDVVLMDLWMPRLDGFAATRRIFESFDVVEGVKPPTVVAMTADSTDGVRGHAALVGMEGVMVKPFGIWDLGRLIEMVGVWRVEGKEGDVSSGLTC